MSKRLDMIQVRNLYERHLHGERIDVLSKESSIRFATLYYAFKRLGPTIRAFRRPKGNWLKLFPITSKEASYCYGLWCADGCWTGDTWQIKLIKEDKYLLDVIQQYVEANHPYRDGNAFRLEIVPGRNIHVSPEWFPRRKSTEGLFFPVLEPDLYPHFIRGYFDGDGSISKRTSRPKQVALYWCGTDKEFLVRMGEELKRNRIRSYIYTEDRSLAGYQNMHTLRVGKREDLHRLYQYMYQDCGDFYLRRKRSVFEVYVNTVLTAKQAVA